MEALKDKARKLLEAGDVKVVIGYAEGSAGGVRALFARKPLDTDKFVLDGRCDQNLGVYLARKEVKKLGKPAVIAIPATVRSVLQLAAESQLAEDGLVVIGVTPDGKVEDLPTFAAMEAFAAAHPAALSDKAKAALDKLDKMSTEERWAYWKEELARCTKCYACRQACPMCYCANCLMECNQPQWIPTSSHHLGNLEWHIVRAMHLAGRCVGCGECGRACPLDIPIHLLSCRMNQSVQEHFGAAAGMSAKLDFALSTFQNNDKEDFIR